jgi:hypothetical protein
MIILTQNAWSAEDSRVVSKEMRELILYEHNFPQVLPAAVFETEVYMYADGTMLIMTQFKKGNVFDKKGYKSFIKNSPSIIEPHNLGDEIGVSIIIQVKQMIVWVKYICMGIRNLGVVKQFKLLLFPPIKSASLSFLLMLLCFKQE